jgi:hypothetical protein
MIKWQVMAQVPKYTRSITDCLCLIPTKTIQIKFNSIQMKLAFFVGIERTGVTEINAIVCQWQKRENVR